MRKKYSLKQDNNHNDDRIIINHDNSESINIKIGTINYDKNQLGIRTNKQKFINNPNKVFMKKGKNYRKK